ncbi:hypothetical protein TRVL_02435 [Trypanosoma vivax]|nr:hypothetical protein TRVL_02435 [Trypanosoma vivax]
MHISSFYLALCALCQFSSAFLNPHFSVSSTFWTFKPLYEFPPMCLCFNNSPSLPLSRAISQSCRQPLYIFSLLPVLPTCYVNDGCSFSLLVAHHDKHKA